MVDLSSKRVRDPRLEEEIVHVREVLAGHVGGEVLAKRGAGGALHKEQDIIRIEEGAYADAGLDRKSVV